LHRAKNITNKPRINEDPKDAMLREFQVRRLLIMSPTCCQQTLGCPHAVDGPCGRLRVPQIEMHLY